MTAHRRPEIQFTDAPRGTCRWCGQAILHEEGPHRGQRNRRRRWHPQCVATYNESDPREIRRRLRKRDRGRCAACGVDTLALKRSLKGRGMTKALRERGFVPRRSLWEVDHIVPLVDGGSHEMANLQSLCTPCHKRKTAAEATERALRSKPTPSPLEAPSTKTPGRPKRKAGSRVGTAVDDSDLDALLAQAEGLNDRVAAMLAARPQPADPRDEA